MTEIQDESCMDPNPLILDWIFGFNPHAPVLNMTTTNKNYVLAFAAGHCVCIYDSLTHQMEKLVGHSHLVKTLSCDASTRFLVTADDTRLINVWDRFCNDEDKPFVVFRVDTPFDGGSIGAACLSHCAKYLISASTSVDHGTRLLLWQWTFGKEKPDAEFVIPAKYGTVVSMKFNQNLENSNYFSVLLSNGISFGTWETGTLSLEFHFPENCSKFDRQITDMTFVLHSRKFMCVKNSGELIIFSDTLTESSGKSVTNRKELIKTIQLAHGVGLTVVKSVDDVIVIGTESGAIRFYDHDLKILYELDMFYASITGLEFNATPRRCKVIKDAALVDGISSVEEEENFEETEILFQKQLLKDCSVASAPILVRNFLAISAGRIAAVDFPNLKYEFLHGQADSVISAFDTHPHKPQLCYGTCSGQIFLYDLNKNLLCAQHKLISQPCLLLDGSAVTCIKYSPCGNHLFCAMGNGDIWYLNPFMLHTIDNRTAPAGAAATPYNTMNNKIMKIEFSRNSIFSVFADDNHTVLLMTFDNNDWHPIGKHRQHQGRICEILFASVQWMEDDRMVEMMFTVAEDQHVIAYDLDKSVKNDKIELSTIIKIEQTAKPKAALVLPPSVSQKFNIANKSTVLMTNDELKLKIYSLPDFVLLHTFVGPLLMGHGAANCIEHMQLVGDGDESKHLIWFGTRTSIAVYRMPFDGNPFRCLATTVDPMKLKTAKLDADGQRIVSVGEQSYSIGVWRMNSASVDRHLFSGGDGLDPFFTMLPGGKHGWLVREMQEMFFYLQILATGVGAAQEKQIEQFINIADVPDFMRGLGFYPTEFQIQNMIAEISDADTKTTIDFVSLVKLFINHRDVDGIDMAKIRKGFEFVLTKKCQFNTQPMPRVTKSEILNLLMDVRGEPVTEQQALEYINELWDPMTGDETLDVSDFLGQILGIAVDSQSMPVFSSINDPSIVNSSLDNKRQHSMDN